MSGLSSNISSATSSAPYFATPSVVDVSNAVPSKREKVAFGFALGGVQKRKADGPAFEDSPSKRPKE